MYEIQTQACVWITLKDSARLAAKLWIPVTKTGQENEKFPAILGKIVKTIHLRPCVR
jgi:predicted acyl esterase